jgi:EAL domain-containing protein (putative c-di-GMP-specific phosphodiesterase class I)
LLRWDHPTLGLVQPNEFIPLLESNGHIVEVGRWVLREACRQMALWHARGSVVALSVNVSGRQLESDAVVDDVREALALSRLRPAMLTLEVTETVLMRDTETSSRRLVELKALGIHLAVDDFGTGYSSLAYLQKFPVDCLKIDRAFTRAMGESRASRALIRTLVQLGRNLDLTILVEGVETTEQVDRLRGEHVDQVQGFLLARPLDPDTLAETVLHLEPELAEATAPVSHGDRPPGARPVAPQAMLTLGSGVGTSGGE